MAKKKRRKFKDVRDVYYLPKKGLCDVSMQGTKPTSKARFAKNIPCNGFSVEGADLTVAKDYSTHAFFKKPVICELDPAFNRILCPPLKR